MSNLAYKFEEFEPSLTIGKVLASGEFVVIQTASDIVRAKPATSCLTRVEVGDLVLLAQNAARSSYVLSVLEREKAQPLTISCERDLRLESTVGKVQIAAKSGINLATAGEIDATSSSISVQSGRASMFIAQAILVGSSFLARLDQLRVVATVVESIADNIVEKCGRLLRRVADSEQVIAGNIEYRAEESVSVHGKHALVTAENLVKLDGEQIHLG
jgi:hypothetical protein